MSQIVRSRARRRHSFPVYTADALESRRLLSTVTWTNATGSGRWTDAGNWSTFAVPSAADDVVVPGGFGQITVTGGVQSVKSIQCDSPVIMLSPSELDVGTGGATFSKNLTLYGATLRGGIYSFISGAALADDNSEAALYGLAVYGTIDLTYGTFDVYDGLSLQGTLELGGSNPVLTGHLLFRGTAPQSLSTPPGGAARVLFGSSSLNSLENQTTISAAAPLGQPVTIGRGVVVDGQGGMIGDGSYLYAPPSHVFINQGTIAADAPGPYALRITQFLSNQGTLSASGGGNLGVINLTGPLGHATVGSGSSLSLAGQYTVSEPVTVEDSATLTLSGSWSTQSTLTLGNGTLNLGGNFSAAGLGTITRTGAGAVNVTGVLDNTGATLSISPSSAPWLLNGGTIRGGTIVDDGSLIPTANAGTLDGVTYRGVLDLSQVNNAYVNVVDGLTVDGTVLIGNAAGTTSGALKFVGSVAQTFNAPPGATAEVRFGGGLNAINNSIGFTGNYYAAGRPLTLGTGVRVDGKNGGFNGDLVGDTIINQGVISASVAGGGIGMSNALTNQGALSVTNGATLNLLDVAGDLGEVSPVSGGTLILGGSYTIDQPLAIEGNSVVTLGGMWHNAGGITADSSTLILNGDFTTADLGALHHTGGTVRLTGVLDNTAATLDLGAIGPVDFYGRITGGTVNGSLASSLLNGQGGKLDGVTFNGNLDGYFAVLGDLTVNGTMHLGGLVFENFVGNQVQDQTLSGDVTILLQKGSIGNDPAAHEGTVRFGPGVTVTGSGTINMSGGELINHGRIIADGPGAAIYVNYANPLVSYGVVDATHGGLLNVGGLTGGIAHASVDSGSSLILGGQGYTIESDLSVPMGAKLELDGAWTNAATIAVAGGTLNLGGTFNYAGMGAVTRSPGSTINLTGILDNTGHTLTFDDSTGSWNFVDGGILNGSVVESGGQGLVFVARRSGSLDGVTFHGDLDISRVNGAALGIADGLLLDGQILLGDAAGTNSGALFFTGRTSQTLAPAPGGSAKIVMGGSSQNDIGNYPYRFLPFAVTFGPGVQIVAQNGRFDDSTSRPTPFINQGSLTILPGGMLSLNATMTNQGQLALGTGATLTTLGLTGGGTIALGPGSTLSVVGSYEYGNFSLSSGGKVIGRIGGGATTTFGQIKVSGTAALDGTLEVEWPAGLATTPGDSIPVVTARARTGTFSNFVVSPSSMAGLLRLQYSGNSAYLLEGGEVVNASGADGPITLSADPNGTDIDWVMGTTRGFLSVADPKGLTVSGEGVLNLDYSAGRPLPAVLHVNGSFTINGLRDLNGTSLDLGKSTVFINYAGAGDPVGWIRSALKSGYNGGNWGGVATPTAGVITSSEANADYGIGYADAADGTGVNRTANTVELKYTRFGDANLDGRVDVADLLAMVHKHGKVAAWDDGDFNYDGVVDSSDRRILLDAFTHRHSRR